MEDVLSELEQEKKMEMLRSMDEVARNKAWEVLFGSSNSSNSTESNTTSGNATDTQSALKAKFNCPQENATADAEAVEDGDEEGLEASGPASTFSPEGTQRLRDSGAHAVETLRTKVLKSTGLKWPGAQGSIFPRSTSASAKKDYSKAVLAHRKSLVAASAETEADEQRGANAAHRGGLLDRAKGRLATDHSSVQASPFRGARSGMQIPGVGYVSIGSEAEGAGAKPVQVKDLKQEASVLGLKLKRIKVPRVDSQSKELVGLEQEAKELGLRLKKDLRT
mmetsp:Transcript_44428/g.69466  ORF Transcript_44428/g.69466 Transcript_44428/m.69466 type:complete len:279 (+) Transcript_44428:263-1099(+)